MASRRVVLYDFESPSITIYMSIYLDADGRLLFEGYDKGSRVLKLKGDSDYEYHYTVQPAEVKKVAKHLGVQAGDEVALLAAIKDMFGGNEAYSRFGAFMKEHDIRFEQFSWR